MKDKLFGSKYCTVSIGSLRWLRDWLLGYIWKLFDYRIRMRSKNDHECWAGKDLERGDDILSSSAIWDITPCSPLKVNRSFGGILRFHLHGWTTSATRNRRHSRWQAAQSACRNLWLYRKQEDSKSVPVVSPAEQNETPVPSGCPTQPSKPIGDKNRVTRIMCKYYYGICFRTL
jgi:hypothetical protein